MINISAIGAILTSQASSIRSRSNNEGGYYNHLKCRPWPEIEKEREEERLERIVDEILRELDKEEL